MAQRRSSAVAGFVLAALIGAAGCDHKVVVPTDPQVVFLTVTPSSATLTIGQTVTLVGIVSGSSNQTVSWTSTNTAVATVGATTGVVTCLSTGVTTIVGAAAAGGPQTATGVLCTSAIQVSVTALGFTHLIGISPCPQEIGTVRVTNLSSVPFTITLSGHSALSVDTGAASFALAAGAFRDIAVSFNCSTQSSFVGEMRITGTAGAASETKTVTVTGTVR